jgi:hypothetical protein
LSIRKANQKRTKTAVNQKNHHVRRDGFYKLYFNF